MTYAPEADYFSIRRDAHKAFNCAKEMVSFKLLYVFLNLI